MIADASAAAVFVGGLAAATAPTHARDVAVAAPLAAAAAIVQPPPGGVAGRPAFTAAATRMSPMASRASGASGVLVVVVVVVVRVADPTKRRGKDLEAPPPRLVCFTRAVRAQRRSIRWRRDVLAPSSVSTRACVVVVFGGACAKGREGERRADVARDAFCVLFVCVRCI